MEAFIHPNPASQRWGHHFFHKEKVDINATLLWLIENSSHISHIRAIWGTLYPSSVARTEQELTTH